MALKNAWLLITLRLIALSALRAKAVPPVTTMGTPISGGCAKKMDWDPKQRKANAEEKVPLSDHLTLSNNVFRAMKTDQMSSSQQTYCYDFRNGALSWKTTFSIKSIKGAEDEVKSYPNVLWKENRSPKISGLKSINVKWSWTIEGRKDPLKCVVFLRMLTSKKAGCRGLGNDCAQTIVRVWLADIGYNQRGTKKTHQPIVLKSTDGQRQYKFHLWVITGNSLAYSLIPAEANVEYETFDADLIPALQAIKSYGFQYEALNIDEFTAGPEPFFGEATLDTKSFTLKIS